MCLAVGVLAAVFAGCVRVAPAMPAAGTPVLTVIAWNMHGDEGDLEQLLDDLSAQTIAARDYVVLLQEAPASGERSVRAIAAARGLSVVFHPTPERTIGNAIVSTLALAGARPIELPRERQPRGALMAMLEAGGVPLFVVSAHLENRLGWWRGLFGDRARGRQAAALLRQLPQGHGILGGDLNTMLGPDEPALRLLGERFPDTPERPVATFRNRLALDHLLLDLPEGWTASRRVLDERYGSDHNPVVTLLTSSRPGA